MSRICNSLVLAAFAFTAGCASDDQSAPVERVAGGHCITAVTVTGGDATSITLGITGTCDLAQLGHTTMAATQTVSTVNGSIVNSTTYTAANGDKLESGFVGQTTSAPGADVVFTGTETYKSGTGRFAGVSGSSALNGTAVLVGASGTGQYTTTGKFTY
jgi:hypothetical protein